MSIQSDVIELQKIQSELQGLNQQRRRLINRAKQLQKNIAEFLVSKEQPGVRFQGNEIRLQTKPIRVPKKPKERDSDAIQVLERHNVSNPQEVLHAILEARKGSAIENQTIKIQKPKRKN